MKVSSNNFNINFGSNYRYNVTSDNLEGDSNVSDKLSEYELKDSRLITYVDFPSFKKSCETGIFARKHITVPEEYDSLIESLLKQNNIKYTKQTKKEALDLNNIYNRIVLPRDNIKRKLVSIDIKKADNLLKKDVWFYIPPDGEKDVLYNRYNGVKDYLESGRNIDATIANISEKDGEPVFSIIDGRHRFAVMRDMGMKKVKIAMDDDSFRLARKYKLILE